MKRIILNIVLILFIEILLAIQFLIQVDIIPHQRILIWLVATLAVIFIGIKEVKDDVAFQELIDGVIKSGKSERKRTDQYIREMKNKKKLTDLRLAGLEEQNTLIARLIKEGLITEKSIYKIIQRYKFYSLFCYQNVPNQDKIEKILGNTFRNPSLEAMESIGFIKVGTRHNLYVLPFTFLTSRLRNPYTLERAIRRQVMNHWKSFLELLKTKDSEFYKKYIRINPDPTNCTYILQVSNFNDVIIDYIGYNAFSTKFKNLLNTQIDLSQLKKEVSKRKYDINKFVTAISYELFLSDMPEKDKGIFISKEDVIKKKLSVDKFIDYKTKKVELSNELKRYFSQRKATNYAKIISEKSEKYFNLFITLGIDLS